MNIGIVINYLGRILALDSVCMIPPLVIALVRGESASAEAFVITVLLQIFAGAAFVFSTRKKEKSLYVREGIVIVVLSWILISLFGSLPMWLSHSAPDFIDSVFETVSGFTTTGATVFSDVESLPMSILYWRSFTHWLGGMGVLVLVLALAPAGGNNGMPLHILRAESPGPTVGKLAPKLHLTARILYMIYIALSVIQFVLLSFDMPVFDAVTTTFATAGTGGFSIKNDSLVSYSTYSQTVTAVFMLLFGVNFSIYFLVLMRDFKNALKNSELRLYLAIIGVSTVSVAYSVISHFSSFGESLHHAFFQVVSIITTTGFSTVDFDLWTEFSHTVLLVLMVVGACAGSTGGGMKVSRVIILFKNLKAEIMKIIHPRAVTVPVMDKKPIEKGVTERCTAFLTAYVLIIAFSVLLVSTDGLDFKTNFSAVLSCVNNIGPGFNSVGPMANFSCYSFFPKIVLIFDMLLGRLEIFPLIVIFLPSTWHMKKF